MAQLVLKDKLERVVLRDRQVPLERMDPQVTMGTTDPQVPLDSKGSLATRVPPVLLERTVLLVQLELLVPKAQPVQQEEEVIQAQPVLRGVMVRQEEQEREEILVLEDLRVHLALPVPPATLVIMVLLASLERQAIKGIKVQPVLKATPARMGLLVLPVPKVRMEPLALRAQQEPQG